jgi:membrane protein
VATRDGEAVGARGPRWRDLSARDWRDILVGALRGALRHNAGDASAALSYYVFLAIPSALLIATGVFSLVAGPQAIASILDGLSAVLPPQAIDLVRQSLTRLTHGSGGVALISVGALLAVWTLSGAMNALMRALNAIHARRETRSFVRQRLTAAGMLLWALLAFVLAFGLLVLGPHLAGWIGEATGAQSVLDKIWWSAEWPILVAGLLLAFAGITYLGPDRERPRWRPVTPGGLVAVAIWLAASSLFSFYVSRFGAYNKAWGSLSAVIVMLTWLWLTGWALLLGAAVDAELERRS